MYDIVCAGHICLDLTPKFPNRGKALKDIFVGGRQSEVNGMAITTGGSVANTGLALNIMGLKTPLMAKIGGDILGNLIGEILVKNGGNSKFLQVAEDETSSYSVVLAVPGCDRIFLHDPAVNDTFNESDIDFDVVAGAKLFHFGYPPLMRQMYLSGGKQLQDILKKVRSFGVTTSVDTAYPDTEAETGKQDWKVILTNILPYTDIFMPSVEELLLMLDRPYFEQCKQQSEDILDVIDFDKVSEYGELLLSMGCKVVVIKCGTMGYYLKTASADVLAQMGGAKPKNMSDWADQEIVSGIFKVDEVKSATGAGDTSVAGFLASLIRGKSAKQAITTACATGAICVTAFGATEAMVPIEQIEAKVDAGWEKRPVRYNGKKFAYSESDRLWLRK